MALTSRKLFNGTQMSEQIWSKALFGAGVAAEVDAGAGDDAVWGDSGDDSLIGGLGNDYLSGGDGNDTLVGGDGVDQLWGGAGADSLLGGAGNDYLDGADGNDTLDGGDGDDQLWGGIGADLLTGGAGADYLNGGDGNDTLLAGAGTDQAWGGGGDDLVVHNIAENRGGSDYANGGAGTDTLRLEMARADWLSAAVQADIARYAAFMNSTAGKAGGTFFFSAFGLQAAEFETAEARVDGVTLTLADDPVTAVADTACLTERATASGNLLANDLVPDLMASLVLLAGPAKGSFSLDAATGAWSYDPGQAYQSLGAGQTATETIRYRVADADGDMGEATLTLTIKGVNDAAVIGGPTAASVTEDVSVDAAGNLAATGTISISDADQGEAAFRTTVIGAAGNLGSLTLAANGAYTYAVSNAAVQYLGGGQTKTDSFTISALDGTTREVVFTVYGQDDGPVAGDDAVTVSEDGAVSLTGLLLANDTSPTATKLITTLGTAGTHGLVTLSGGEVTYAAGSAYQSLKAGQTATDSFTYTLSDGTGSQMGTVAATVTVTVTGVNDAPTAGGDAAFTLVGKPVTISVLANDTDPESGVLTVSRATGAAHGTTSVNADGTITYTPAANYVGPDSFTYVVRDDGGLESAATVSIVVGRAAHVTSGGDVFLQGQYMEIGVSSAGSLGTATAAPGGFHPTNGGISYVVDADGWDSGSAPATGDFTLPGSPVDTIVLGVGGSSYVQDERSGRHDIATTTADTTLGLALEATTTGTVAGVRLEQKIDLDPNATYYRTTITLTNTTGAALSDIRFLRSFDPDQDVAIYGNYSTHNDVLANPSAGSDVAVSRAIGASSGIGVSLIAFDQDARGSNYGFANYDAYDSRAWTSPVDLNGTAADAAITMSFRIATLAAGATVTKTFYTAINVNQGANDFVVGTDGANTLSGGAGNDLLLGLAGNDVLTGGTGSDTFIVSRGSGADRITDFVAGAGTDDVIELRGTPYASFAALRAAATDTADGALLNLGSGDTLLLLGVTVASLHADDFRLVA